MLHGIYNFRELTPRLAAAGQPDEREFMAVARAGFALVVNMALHPDPRDAEFDEKALVEQLGMRYIHIPVEFSAPTDADLERFFQAMDEHRDDKVLVHCAASKRASVFLGLYWHLREGRSVEEAFALQRDIWEPDAVWSRFMARQLDTRDAEVCSRTRYWSTAGAGRHGLDPVAQLEQDAP